MFCNIIDCGRICSTKYCEKCKHIQNDDTKEMPHFDGQIVKHG